MEIITSSQNSKVKKLRSLKDRKFREKYGLFVIEGERGVEELLNYPDRIEEIFVTQEFYNSSELDLSNYEINILEEDLFKDVANTVTPQGIMATVKFSYLDLEDLPSGRYIYTDRIQDPANLGGMIRSVDAFGIDGIIIGPGTVDHTNDKVVRGTMASILRTKIYRSKGLEDLKRLKKTHSLQATVLDKKSVPLSQIDKDKDQIIIIGNEGSGVSEEILELVDGTIYIPMPGFAESLNASIAASIVMYELIR